MNNYLLPQQVGDICVELTTHCNALCPLCARTSADGKGVNPDLKMASLDIETLKIFFSKDVMERLWTVLFSGTFGDPCMSEALLPFVEHLLKTFRHPQFRIELHTNGGMRDPNFFSTLARAGQDRLLTCFSIDGLKDTNSIYRRRTNWDSIMANAKSYIAAGGKARWQFIVFKHNQHQIDEARDLAEKMGFFEFRLRKTTMELPLDQDAGSSIADNPRFLSMRKTRQQKEAEERKKLNVDRFTFLNQAPITCDWRRDSSLYLAASGLLWPCCHLGANEQEAIGKMSYPWFDGKKVDGRLWMQEHVIDRYRRPDGRAFNDIHHFSLVEILKSPLFANDLVEGWSETFSRSSNKRLCRCAIRCGSSYKDGQISVGEGLVFRKGLE